VATSTFGALAVCVCPSTCAKSSTRDQRCRSPFTYLRHGQLGDGNWEMERAEEDGQEGAELALGPPCCRQKHRFIQVPGRPRGEPPRAAILTVASVRDPVGRSTLPTVSQRPQVARFRQSSADRARQRLATALPGATRSSRCGSIPQHCGVTHYYSSKRSRSSSLQVRSAFRPSFGSQDTAADGRDILRPTRLD
jgi:hypothetical protein